MTMIASQLLQTIYRSHEKLIFVPMIASDAGNTEDADINHGVFVSHNSLSLRKLLRIEFSAFLAYVTP